MFDDHHAARRQITDAQHGARQLARLHLVRAGGGFVEQEVARAQGQRTSDLDAALQGEGKLGGTLFGDRGQAQGLEHEIDVEQRPIVPRRPLGGGDTHFDVLTHGEATEESDALERPRHAASRRLVDGNVDHRVTVDGHRSRGRSGRPR